MTKRRKDKIRLRCQFNADCLKFIPEGDRFDDGVSDEVGVGELDVTHVD